MQTASNTTTLDEVVVLELGPEYDVINEGLIGPLHSLFETRLDGMRPRGLVVDLSQVSWACSSFLGLLARWWKILSAEGGTRTAVCGVSATIRQRLSVTGLNTMWPAFATTDEAVAAFRNGE
jgi:anti-anti-sigma factor